MGKASQFLHLLKSVLLLVRERERESNQERDGEVEERGSEGFTFTILYLLARACGNKEGEPRE